MAELILYCDECRKGQRLVYLTLDYYELECGHKVKPFTALPEIDEGTRRFIAGGLCKRG